MAERVIAAVEGQWGTTYKIRRAADITTHLLGLNNDIKTLCAGDPSPKLWEALRRLRQEQDLLLDKLLELRPDLGYPAED